MEEKTTYELDKMLENGTVGNMSSFFSENKDSMLEGDRPFYDYMKSTIQGRIKLADLFHIADMSERYGGRILRMETHTTDRDIILRLCIAGQFNLAETNKALKLYGMNELYSKDKRDACIIMAIHRRIYDFKKINDILSEQKLEPLHVYEG